MTLLTAPSSATAYAVSRGGGVLSDCSHASLAPLPAFLYREMRWCAQREEFQEFVFTYEAAGGRVGICLGCGAEDAVPFSRVTEAE